MMQQPPPESTGWVLTGAGVGAAVGAHGVLLGAIIEEELGAAATGAIMGICSPVIGHTVTLPQICVAQIDVQHWSLILQTVTHVSRHEVMNGSIMGISSLHAELDWHCARQPPISIVQIVSKQQQMQHSSLQHAYENDSFF